MTGKLSLQTETKLGLLFEWFRDKACVVAFSGGVDSSVLAKALIVAYERSLLKIRPVGFFAESFTSTELEKTDARRVASEIGLPLVVLASKEFDDPQFVANTPKRCYWCKKIRFSSIKELAQRDYGDPNGAEVTVVDGSNLSDLGDYRPGVQAANEVGVKSPLAEVGLIKSELREIARFWNISVAEKPSTPCLATRLTYNMPLSNEALRQVENAELAVKSLGFTTCRARIDAPKTVRIELLENEIKDLINSEKRKKIVVLLRELGFNFISLDLEGFFSGKNNRALSE